MDQSINKPVISEILLPSVHPFYSGKNYLSQIKWSDLGQLASRVLSQKDGEKDESEKSGNYL